MSEPIYKLQPHRTMHLQGFDSYGAAAALWGASATGFDLSGVFRDQADFAVLVLFEKDDPFGHPRFSYLPDGNFAGIKLEFDVSFHGVHPFESKKWPWTDWKTLNAYNGAGELIQKPLIELATGPAGRVGASGKFILNGAYLLSGDRVVLWYQNLSFDSSLVPDTTKCVQAIFWNSDGGPSSCEQDIFWQAATLSCEQDIYWSSVTGSCEQDIQAAGVTTSCEQDIWWQSVALSAEHNIWWQPVSLSVQQAFWWQGNASYRHSVWIAGQQYYCDENGWSSSEITNNIREQIVARDPNVNVSQDANVLTFALKPYVPGPISISSSDGSAPGTLDDYRHWVQIGSTQYSCLQGSLSSAQVAANIAAQIAANDPICTATVGGSQGNGVIVSLRSGQGGPVMVTDSDGGGPTTIADYVHWVQIGANRYSQVQGALSAADIASAIASAIAAGDPVCTASGLGNAITVSLRTGQAGPVTVSSSDGSTSATLSGSSSTYHWVQCGANRYQCQQGTLTAAEIAANIAAQIAASDPNCTATSNSNAVIVSLRSGVLGPIQVSSSDGSSTVTLAGANHWVKVGNTTYSCDQGSLTAAQIAANIAGQITASDPNCSAAANDNVITVTLRSGVAGPISVSSSDGSGPATLNGVTHWVQLGTTKYSCDQGALTAAQIASDIAGQIAGNDTRCMGSATDNAITISLRAGQVGPVEVSSSDGSAGVTLSGIAHSVAIGEATYTCDQRSEPDAAGIAANIAAQITASDPNCTATAGSLQGNEITIKLRDGVVTPVSVSSTDGSAEATLIPIPASAVCESIADQINAIDWAANGPVMLSAEAGTDAETGNACITITAEPGVDGNSVAFYELHHNDHMRFTPDHVRLAGGVSDDLTWHVAIDFDALGWTDLQKLWLTFAPVLENSAAYVPSEWSVTVTNWTVTDLYGARALKVAGPGSVRIEESSSWVIQAGYWEWAPADGFAFWSGGRAIRSAYSAWETRSLTIETHCQHTHDIYVGTRIDFDCGIIQAMLDGGAPVTLDAYGAAAQVRRKLFSNVGAGRHTVVITCEPDKNENSQGWYFYFDFLECAAPGDVPDAPETRTDVGLATDFDTDATYKLPPQRVVWNIQKLGLVGEIDHYCGVFWWKQAARSGGSFSHATVTFGGTFADKDEVWVHIGDTAIGKTCFPDDTPPTIAAHLACFINATLVGVWAQADGPVLTITVRSWLPNWTYPSVPAVAESGSLEGTISCIGDLQSGSSVGEWVIDPAAEQIFNRAFRDWHADYFSCLRAAGLGVVASFSQELVNPPDQPGAVWVQRFPDGTAVRTATGFGALYSSICAFSAPVEAYMEQAHAAMAALMAAAGLTPRLQFGEVLWWYIQGASGMAFYDADTAAAALAALGRPLAAFYTPNDDPSVNGYADADFLRSRLASYVAAIQSAVLAQAPSALFELLWPMDVNDPDRCRLLRYVNLPPAWQSRAGSGFDTLLCEGFQYAGVDHNLDTAKRCATYPFAELSWDRAHCRYLMGWYNLAWPWQREYQAAQRTGVPVIKFWAYDHLCLFGWPLPLPKQPSNPSFI
jgi:hypothetical protein